MAKARQKERVEREFLPSHFFVLLKYHGRILCHMQVCISPNRSLVLKHFHFLHHGFSVFKLDGDLEIGKVAVDVQRNALVLLRFVIEFQTDVGAREIVLGRQHSLVLVVDLMEREDGVDDGKDAGQFDAQFLVLARNEVLYIAFHVVPQVAVGDCAIDIDALRNDGLQFALIDVEVFQQLLLHAAGRLFLLRGSLRSLHVLVVNIVYPADFIIGHGNGTDAGDVVVLLVLVGEFDNANFGLVIVFDDIDGRKFLNIVLISSHVGVVETEEDADVLEIDVGTVVDGDLDFVILVGESPVHGRLHGDVEEGLFEEDLLERTVHILLAVLHVAEQAVIYALVATTVEVVEDFLLALLHIVMLGIVVRLQQVGAEDAESLHGGLVEPQQILPLCRFVQVGTSLVTVEQVGQFGSLTGIFNGSLVEVGDGFGRLALGAVKESLEHEGRGGAGRIEGCVLIQNGFSLIQ